MKWGSFSFVTGYEMAMDTRKRERICKVIVKIFFYTTFTEKHIAILSLSFRLSSPLTILLHLLKTFYLYFLFQQKLNLLALWMLPTRVFPIFLRDTLSNPSLFLKTFLSPTSNTKHLLIWVCNLSKGDEFILPYTQIVVKLLNTNCLDANGESAYLFWIYRTQQLTFINTVLSNSLRWQ